ncbi:MAG: hypothetical protein ABIH23_12815 [bacterium]
MRFLASSLQNYRREFGTFPSNLLEFSQRPQYSKESMLDPYGKDNALFGYTLVEEGDEQQAVLYTVGLDRIDDNGIIPYRPSNGLRSRGDIVIRITDDEILSTFN